jgi:hypothetical protein
MEVISSSSTQNALTLLHQEQQENNLEEETRFGSRSDQRGSLSHPILWPCAGCHKVDGRKGKNGVQCDNCDAWWHASCGNVNVDAATDQTPWRCPKCSSSIPRLSPTLSQVVLNGIRSIREKAPSKVPKPQSLINFKPRETTQKSKVQAATPSTAVSTPSLPSAKTYNPLSLTAPGNARKRLETPGNARKRLFREPRRRWTQPQMLQEAALPRRRRRPQARSLAQPRPPLQPREDRRRPFLSPSRLTQLLRHGDLCRPRQGRRHAPRLPRRVRGFFEPLLMLSLLLALPAFFLFSVSIPVPLPMVPLHLHLRHPTRGLPPR